MARRRITTRNGNRVVAYSTKSEAKGAKDRAPGKQRIRKVKTHRTKGGKVEKLPNPPWYVVADA